jgi:hypothetical protein
VAAMQYLKNRYRYSTYLSRYSYIGKGTIRYQVGNEGICFDLSLVKN